MALTTGTYAIFNTTEGKITVRLFPEVAPITVANFVELAEGKKEWTHPLTGVKSTNKLYDGTIFHRVIKDFMVQGAGGLVHATLAYHWARVINMIHCAEIIKELLFDDDLQGTDLLVESATFVGQRDRPGRAIEQADADAALQSGDRAADAGG